MTRKGSRIPLQVFFIQYNESLCSYYRVMAHRELIRSPDSATDAARHEANVLAAGLFGYSICDGQMRSFKPTEGYLRDMEQMPSFPLPSVSSFVAQYLSSNIGKTRSSS